MIDHFKQFGWVLFDLIDPAPVLEAKEALEKKLSELLGRKESLEDYHKQVQDDQKHTNLQFQLASFFHEKRFARRIIESQKSFFQKLIGLDVLVQKNPYLRIARPQKPQDNIGYHRDTFYGGSPFEISVLVPYVDLSNEASLSVMDGSHILSEDSFPVTQIQNPDEEIYKGSQKHQMGFLYAPKVMNSSIEKKMKPVPLKLGQALIFSLSTVHGSVENRGVTTRWSSDIRVLNSLAPVDLSARPDYYEVFTESPVTSCAHQYYANNKTPV